MPENKFEADLLFQGKDRNFFKKDDVAYITSEILCSVLTIIGNTLVLLVYLREKQPNRSQKLIHKYIISMALADLLMGLTGIPMAIYVSVGLPHHRFWCLVFLSIQTMFGMVSVLALVAASTAKYLSLAHPIWFSTKFNDLKATLHILVHWLLGALIGWLPSMGLNNAPDKAPIMYRNITNVVSDETIVENDAIHECESNSTHICYREFQCYFNDMMPKQMSQVLMFAVILPSCLVLIAIYIRIYQIFKRMINKGSKGEPVKTDWMHIFLSLFACCCTMRQGPRKMGDLKTREVQTTVVLFITVLFFAICWVPLYIIDVMFSLAPQSLSIDIETINALIVLRHFNSVLNPFLYAYHMKGFKKSLKQIFAKIFFCCGDSDKGWRSPISASSTDDTTRESRSRATICNEKGISDDTKV